MTDSEIIELYFKKDEQAIIQTDRSYGWLCKKITWNILKNGEDTEECVNDTYIGIWNSIPPTRPDNLKAYICRIARNLALKRLEYMTREKRQPEAVMSIDELACEISDERFAPDKGNEEIGLAISEFLRLQNADVRNVFIRKYYFFDSIKEIAKHYSFTEGKVKSMLFQTRRKLKAYLIKEGIYI